MAKQLWIPTYFLTFSCADLRWEKLPYITNILNNLGFSDEELNNLSYQELCNLLDNDPVLVGEYFQYKFEVFLKKSYLMAP